MLGKLILVRHGQSEYNAQGLFTGLHDPGLTSLGVAQAKTCARLINRRWRVDHIICSRLARASQTVNAMQPLLCNAPEVCPADARLNERDYGALSGLSKESVAQKYGSDTLTMWRRGFDTAPPQGESLADTQERVVACYQDTLLPLRQRGKNVLAVAHGNSIRALLMSLLDIAPSDVCGLEIGWCSPWVVSSLGRKQYVAFAQRDTSDNNHFPSAAMNSNVRACLV